MDVQALLTATRARSGLSQRALAELAHTSHATISAYEHGRVTPSVETMDRLVSAAGFDLDVRVTPRIRSHRGLERGVELELVLDLAEQFPRRSPSANVDMPMFGATS